MENKLLQFGVAAAACVFVASTLITLWMRALPPERRTWTFNHRVKKCLLIAALSAVIEYVAVNGSLALLADLLGVRIGLLSDTGILLGFFLGSFIGAYSAILRTSR